MPEQRWDLDACLHYRYRLAALLDGELDPAERSAVQAHVRTCEACAADLRRQQATRSALRDAGRGLSASPALSARIAQQLDLQPDQRRPHPRRWRPFAALGTLAAALALLAFGLLWRTTAPGSSVSLLARVGAVLQQEAGAGAPVEFASQDAKTLTAWVRSHGVPGMDVPQLDDEGYYLLGARREPALGRDAVSLVYEGPHDRVTCTVLAGHHPLAAPAAAPAGSPALHVQRLAAATVVGWRDAEATYLLSSQVDPGELVGLARVASHRE